MLVCAVEHGSTAVECGKLVPHVRRAVVDVKRGDAAILDASVTALAVVEVAADKTADVLNVRLLLLAHGGVFGRSLACASGLLALCDELRPPHALVAPLFG